ncbi:MAG: class I SAM-dependent methyltransferase [Cyclobacteriaceae bacterium]|nr:class I SAM-dependent methyltransferase [Cyclobacteriaceae bacterium]UYN86874.1 MAG: class I SAM-dependent methyltransferase [Cyclobacteriaceae bacterium]
MIGSAYRVVRKFTLNWKYRLVALHSKKGTLLDYGCGTGEFLKTMQTYNWDVCGLEPSEIARKKARLLTGKTIAETQEQLPKKLYNAITLWHVLEHIPDLNLVLQTFKNSLHHNGIIFIAVPNYQSPESLHYKNDWAGYDVPRHLWHFSKKSMELLLDQNNFKLHAVCPMPIDAYYISLLSEKNRGNTGLNGILRAIIQGMHSNTVAKKTCNHSSLIYIAKLK